VTPSLEPEREESPGPAPLSGSPARRRGRSGGRRVKPPGRAARVRGRDLPRSTFVRGAVVLACPSGPDGDAAVRFAFREAALRRAPLVVIACFASPVDPDLESVETPESELRRRARAAAEASLCRALAVPYAQLPAHEIVTEPGPATEVLLRDCAGAQLIVVVEPPRNPLARFAAIHADGAVLVRRSRSPVALIPRVRARALDGSQERIP
jgi:hypothetical protein